MRDMTGDYGRGDWHSVVGLNIRRTTRQEIGAIPEEDVVAVLEVRPLGAAFHLGRRTPTGIERLESQAETDGNGLFGIRIALFGDNVFVLPAEAGLRLDITLHDIVAYGHPLYRDLPVYS